MLRQRLRFRDSRLAKPASISQNDVRTIRLRIRGPGVAAKHVRNALGRTYDAWFDSRTPVTRTQFWALLLLGGTLITSGMTVLLKMLSKYPLATLDAPSAIILVIPVGIVGAIIAFGVLHIRRAFAGRP
jgi:hypothetical protein